MVSLQRRLPWLPALESSLPLLLRVQPPAQPARSGPSSEQGLADPAAALASAARRGSALSRLCALRSRLGTQAGPEQGGAGHGDLEPLT